MFMFFNNCIYHVCQLLYYSIVHTLYYIHGTACLYKFMPGGQDSRCILRLSDSKTVTCLLSAIK